MLIKFDRKYFHEMKSALKVLSRGVLYMDLFGRMRLWYLANMSAPVVAELLPLESSNLLEDRRRTMRKIFGVELKQMHC